MSTRGRVCSPGYLQSGSQTGVLEREWTVRNGGRRRALGAL